jgi:hypothetical protein
VLWVFLCVPETKGLPLESVQDRLRRWTLTRLLVRTLTALGVSVDPRAAIFDDEEDEDEKDAPVKPAATAPAAPDSAASAAVA